MYTALGKQIWKITTIQKFQTNFKIKHKSRKPKLDANIRIDFWINRPNQLSRKEFLISTDMREQSYETDKLICARSIITVNRFSELHSREEIAISQRNWLHTRHGQSIVSIINFSDQSNQTSIITIKTHHHIFSTTCLKTKTNQRIRMANGC